MKEGGEGGGRRGRRREREEERALSGLRTVWAFDFLFKSSSQGQWLREGGNRQVELPLVPSGPKAAMLLLKLGADSGN